MSDEEFDPGEYPYPDEDIDQDGDDETTEEK